MTTINKQHGFYGALAAHYGSTDHRNAIWDITVKRLGQIHPEKSADEILEFLNGRAGRHLADEIFDGVGSLSYGVAMLRVAMLNKLKMAKWWGRITTAQRHAPSQWTSACCTDPQSRTKCATAASANWWTVRWSVPRTTYGRPQKCG